MSRTSKKNILGRHTLGNTRRAQAETGNFSKMKTLMGTKNKTSLAYHIQWETAWSTELHPAKHF